MSKNGHGFHPWELKNSLKAARLNQKEALVARF